MARVGGGSGSDEQPRRQRPPDGREEGGGEVSSAVPAVPSKFRSGDAVQYLRSSGEEVDAIVLRVHRGGGGAGIPQYTLRLPDGSERTANDGSGRLRAPWMSPTASRAVEAAQTAALSLALWREEVGGGGGGAWSRGRRMGSGSDGSASSSSRGDGGREAMIEAMGRTSSSRRSPSPAAARLIASIASDQGSQSDDCDAHDHDDIDDGRSQASRFSISSSVAGAAGMGLLGGDLTEVNIHCLEASDVLEALEAPERLDEAGASTEVGASEDPGVSLQERGHGDVPATGSESESKLGSELESESESASEAASESDGRDRDAEPTLRRGGRGRRPGSRRVRGDRQKYEGLDPGDGSESKAVPFTTASSLRALGNSVVRTISASAGRAGAQYLQVERASEGGRTPTKNEINDIASKYMFSQEEAKDYDTASRELEQKHKRRELMTENEWGDGTSRRVSYDDPSHCLSKEENDAVGGATTTWGRLAEKYVPRKHFQFHVLTDNYIDRGGARHEESIDNYGLNDNDKIDSYGGGYGELDIFGWRTSSTRKGRRQKRQLIFWAIVVVVFGTIMTIVGIGVAKSHHRLPCDPSNRARPMDCVELHGDEEQGHLAGNDITLSPEMDVPMFGGPSVAIPSKPLGSNRGFSHEDIEHLLLQITPKAVLADPTTAQHAAFKWMLDDLDTSIIYVAESGTMDRIIQRYVLAVIYHSTGGSSGTWTTEELWMTGEDECTWFGVECGANERSGEGDRNLLEKNRKRSMHLVKRRIKKDLLDEKYISTLDLSENGLEGSIPQEIGSLSKLSELLLQGNKLRKTIPEALYSLQHLEIFYLDHNKLTGSISDSIGTMLSLRHLDFSDNELVGFIPNGFGNLGSMIDLRLNDNDLSGDFPLEIANMKNLMTFLANDNRIGGSVPQALGKELRNLVVIRLQNNELFGKMPAFASPKLEEIHLGSNALDGSIEPPKSQILRELSLGKNFLTGTIPSNIDVLFPELEILDLSFNQLNGSIPTSLGNLSSAREIKLNDNIGLAGNANLICEGLLPITSLSVDLQAIECSCCDCC